jgi:hypothetical protein
VFDLVEGEVERSEFGECFEAFDVRYEVVVKIDFCKRCSGVGGYLDGLYPVLP